MGADGRQDMMLSNGPSPDGLAVSDDMWMLFVAMTRANQIWRCPIQADGTGRDAVVVTALLTGTLPVAALPEPDVLQA